MHESQSGVPVMDWDPWTIGSMSNGSNVSPPPLTFSGLSITSQLCSLASAPGPSLSHPDWEQAVQMGNPGGGWVITPGIGWHRAHRTPSLLLPTALARISLVNSQGNVD